MAIERESPTDSSSVLFAESSIEAAVRKMVRAIEAMRYVWGADSNNFLSDVTIRKLQFL